MEKEAPVPAVPMFEMVEENVRAVPAVAVDGVAEAAVRSGWAGAVVVNDELAEYPVPVALVA